MNRRGEKRVGAGREKSPSFTKITREMIINIDEQIIVIFIWKMDGIGYVYLENQAFSTVTFHTVQSPRQFLPPTEVRIRKYSLIFGFHGKIHR